MTRNDFRIRTDMENVEPELRIVEKTDTLSILKFSIRFQKKLAPSPIRLEWKMPVGNVLSLWSPLIGFSRILAIRDCLGKIVTDTVIGLPKGATLLDVPVCGLAEIMPQTAEKRK